ncbi:MAG TPA: hypothetical protein VGV88_00210 [Candidatus Dormibacteraeota bacterium]|nr:hypothetical protein [Candidatus Dormibacteraeota bacterium]
MPDMGTVVAITVWFVLIAVVLDFAVLGAGLLTVVTGRSFAPAIRGLRRHVPASQNDQRLAGMSLSLLAVGQLLMMVALMVVITLSTAQATGERAPVVGMYLVTLVAFAAAVACTFASLFIGQRVRYANIVEPDEEEEFTRELTEAPRD